MVRPGGGTTRRLFAVPRERRGERIDAFLRRELPAGADRVRALLSAGMVRVRGRSCAPLRRLFGGEEVEVLLEGAAPPAAGPAQPVLRVLSQDADHLVVLKPAGLPVEPAGPASASAVGAAALLVPCAVDGRPYPGLPHRIDRDTSGCLLLARTDAGLRSLRAAFEAGLVEKDYLALVGGEPPDEGRLDTPHGRDPGDPRRFTGRLPAARRARLSFRVERRLGGGALLRVRLETGRTHQIRVQLSEAGWPILGDATYGVPSPHLARQGLHAWRLAFPRPSDGVRVGGGGPGAARPRPGRQGAAAIGTVNGPATASPPRRSSATTQTCAEATPGRRSEPSRSEVVSTPVVIPALNVPAVV